MAPPSEIPIARVARLGSASLAPLMGDREQPATMLEPIIFLAGVTAGQAFAQPSTGSAPPAARIKINPTTRTLRFVVPVTDNGFYLGEINLTVATDDALSVDSDRLFQMLEPIVKPEVLTRLKSAVRNNTQITAIQLSAEQIGLTYDSENLALTIIIPALARKRESLSLRASPSFGGETLDPAPFSAFMNLRSSVDIVERGQNRGLAAPVSLLDTSLRAFGIVAEAEGYVSFDSQDSLFRRTGTRLVFDDVRDLIRFSAGDIPIFTRGFQGTGTVAGISASRFYSVLEPGQEFRSAGAQNFTLFAPSTVETIVNGESVEQRLLQPGTYTLQNFPLAEGANSVKLIIDDPTGKRRTINFSVYSDLQLLQPGATEFSAFAGVYSHPATFGIAYSSKWLASGFVRKGLSQQVTAGFDAQGDSTAQQIGAEALIGSAFGLIALDVSLSHRAQGGEGIAAAATFEKVVGGSDTTRGQSLRGAVEFRSGHFSTPGTALEYEPLKLRASVGYQMSFGLDTYLALDGQYVRDRLKADNEYSARLSGGFSLGPGLAFVAEAQLNRLGGERGREVRIGIRKRFGQASTVQADINTRGIARASMQTQGGAGVGAWSASGTLGRDGNAVAINGAATYSANRAELGIAQFAGYDNDGGRINDVRTSIRAATSVSFADGVFAIGRPIQEAFLIADAHRSLRSKEVVLEPQLKSEQAHSGALGAAVDGALSAYSPRTLIYDVPNAPAGYDLGPGNIEVLPPYKSGYHLRVGSDYHLLVIGRLLDSDGKPIELLAGRAIELRAPKRAPVTMFTSRSGKFGAQGLRPGRWRIEMPTEGNPTVYEINVTDDPSGTVRIGDIWPIKSTGPQR